MIGSAKLRHGRRQGFHLRQSIGRRHSMVATMLQLIASSSSALTWSLGIVRRSNTRMFATGFISTRTSFPRGDMHHISLTRRTQTRQRMDSSCFIHAVQRNVASSVVMQSHAESTQAQAQAQAQAPAPPRRAPGKQTGGLRRLPVVKRSNEIIARAEKTSKRIKPDSSIKNARTRARKHGAERLDALTKGLCLPLRDAVNGYRRELRRLHPFETVVADLTVRARQKKDGLTLSDVLDEIHEARKEILLSSKDWIASTKAAPTAREASEIAAEGTQRLCEVFADLASTPLDGLIQMQKSLRTIPAVQLDQPAVVLVGAPNVGKSSIVRAISSAKPEVNNYPFTTRGMTLGHVEIYFQAGQDNHDNNGDHNSGGYTESQKCQIMDSPGVLVRPDGDQGRNEMEALTLAAMRHLPTAVMYVMDFSGQAGDKCSSIEHQLQLRREMRKRFPRRPWMDVVSKVDLGVAEGAMEELQEILKEEGVGGDGSEKYIVLSIKEGEGVEELRHSVMHMLGEVKVVLDAMMVASTAQD